MLNDKLIFEEYLRMANRPLPRVFWKLEAELIAGGRRIVLRNIKSRDTVRDYEKQFADESYLVTQVGMATYKDLIIPRIDDLKIRLTKIVQNDKGLPLAGAPKVVYVYDAHLLDPQDIDMSSPSRGYESQAINEISQLVTASFQLTEPKLTEMRLADVSGTYYNKDLKSILQGLMSYDLGETKGPDALAANGYSGVRGVDVVTPTNGKVYEHLTINTGTKLTQLARFLQEEKGVYAAGINRYYQNGKWYLYPLYDYSRFNSTKKTLTIINIPQDEMMSPERSYDVRADNLFIVATGKTTMLDESESVAKNIGTGLRFTRASSLIDGMTKSKDNKCTPNIAESNQAFSIEKRRDGLTNAPYSSRGMTDNPYPEISEMAKGQGTTIKVNWENSKPDLLYPAMPVKFLYMRGTEIKTAMGTLLGVRITEAPGTGNLTDNDYRTSCSLVIHVKKRKD